MKTLKNLQNILESDEEENEEERRMYSRKDQPSPEPLVHFEDRSGDADVLDDNDEEVVETYTGMFISHYKWNVLSYL